jgi:beta-galactosidase
MLLKNDLAELISLDGIWQFSLGENLSWSEIHVPGCWESQGYSKFTDGPARYRRELIIPASWEGKAIFVEFEAVCYACTLSLNGIEVGNHRGLWTPFAIDLTAASGREPARADRL